MSIILIFAIAWDWDSYHEKVEKREQLFDAAVKAVIEMGNCSSQRHLNQEQANTIEAFLTFDGGDRNQLCVDIWDKAKPQLSTIDVTVPLVRLKNCAPRNYMGKRIAEGIVEVYNN